MENSYIKKGDGFSPKKVLLKIQHYLWCKRTPTVKLSSWLNCLCVCVCVFKVTLYINLHIYYTYACIIENKNLNGWKVGQYEVMMAYKMKTMRMYQFKLIKLSKEICCNSHWEKCTNGTHKDSFSLTPCSFFLCL